MPRIEEQESWWIIIDAMHQIRCKSRLSILLKRKPHFSRVSMVKGTFPSRAHVRTCVHMNLMSADLRESARLRFLEEMLFYSFNDIDIQLQLDSRFSF